LSTEKQRTVTAGNDKLIMPKTKEKKRVRLTRLEIRKQVVEEEKKLRKDSGLGTHVCDVITKLHICGGISILIGDRHEPGDEVGLGDIFAVGIFAPLANDPVCKLQPGASPIQIR
jgi:hypothetical protein